MDEDGSDLAELEALEGVAARTVELVVLASSLAERMSYAPRSPTLDTNLSKLDDTVRRGQRHLQHLVQDEIDGDAGRASALIVHR